MRKITKEQKGIALVPLIIIIAITAIVAVIGTFVVINLTGNKDTSNVDSKEKNSNKGLISSYESGTTMVSFYEDGRVVVSDNSGNGTGRMADYGVNMGQLPPWNTDTCVDKTKMKKLIVEDGVLSLGNYAFTLVTLEEIEWSDDLERIGTENFARQYKLALPTLPANLKEIGGVEFAQNFKCTDNNTLVIPKNCTVIGPGAFYNAEIHHFIIESEELTIKKEANKESSAAFWVGCKHNIIIEVKNEAVKQAILEDLDLKGRAEKERIQVIVKE